jgi:hypothetical protein
VHVRQQRLADALAARTGGRTPLTLLAPWQRASDAFPDATLTRLREIKRRRDPNGVLRSNFPVLA